MAVVTAYAFPYVEFTALSQFLVCYKDNVEAEYNDNRSGSLQFLSNEKRNGRGAGSICKHSCSARPSLVAA